MPVLSAHWVLLPCNGKIPIVEWSEIKENDPTRFLNWAEEHPGADWAVLTGGASGDLVCFDADDIFAYAWALGAHRGPAPKTPWHSTPSGFHVLFQAPSGLVQELPSRLRLDLVFPDAPSTAELIVRAPARLPPGPGYTWRLRPNPGVFRTSRSCAGVWPPASLPRWLLDGLERFLGRPSAPKPADLNPSVIRTLAHDLLTREELIIHLMKTAGREPVPIGKGFRCILPGHAEEHPSAAFWRAEDGTLFYVDFHRASGKSGCSLPEVSHALRTGCVKRLSHEEWIAELAQLASETGLLVAETRRLLRRNTQLLQEVLNLQGVLQQATPFIKEGVCCKPMVFRVWDKLAEALESSAEAGYLWTQASVRWLAAKAGTTPELACRALNLLCALGLLVKVRHGRGGGDPRAWKATAVALGALPEAEVLRRARALADVPLRAVNRRTVRERLGAKVAEAVYGRAMAYEAVLEASLVA